MYSRDHHVLSSTSKFLFSSPKMITSTFFSSLQSQLCLQEDVQTFFFAICKEVPMTSSMPIITVTIWSIHSLAKNLWVKLTGPEGNVSKFSPQLGMSHTDGWERRGHRQLTGQRRCGEGTWGFETGQRNQGRNAGPEEDFLKTGDPAHHPHESKDAGKKGRGVGWEMPGF